MSDSTDDLLRALQARSSGESLDLPDDAVDDDGFGDIEAYLASIDDEGGSGDDDLGLPSDPAPAKPAAAPSTATATKAADPLEAEFLKLEGDGALVAPPSEPKAAPSEKAPADEAASGEDAPQRERAVGVGVVAKERSEGLHASLRFLRWSAILVPTALAWWVVGTAASQFAEAGWLVAAVATLGVLVLPTIARVATKRGSIGVWTGVWSLALLTLLIAPMSVTAGKNMAQYGHWPASVLASYAGWKADSLPVTASASVGEALGNLLLPADQRDKVHASLLGSETPLDADKRQADDSKADAPEAKADDSPNEGDAKAAPPAAK